MRAVKQKHTGPELIVRELLSSLGLRYRLHQRNLPGSPDIVFASRKIAVFVHGCFWHRHGGCKRASAPKANNGFWEEKFERNQSRDRENRTKLEFLGWRLLVVWECETTDRDKLKRRLGDLFQIG
jgi:DNA mismatch endonuclease (patch repair protein)